MSLSVLLLAWSAGLLAAPLPGTVPPTPAESAATATAPTPAEMLHWAAVTLEKGTLYRQQKAIGILATSSDPEADRLLLEQYQRLVAGTLPLGLWLEVLEAAAERDTPAWRARLAERNQACTSAKDPLLPWRECLQGGDADSGRDVFEKKPQAACIRCHTVGDHGGAIGPNLTGLGDRTDRVNILESIVFPSAVIVMGFDNVLLKLRDGTEITGVRSREGRDEWEITSAADGTRRQIPARDILETTALPSAMPPGFGQALTKRELRDLVEYLAGRR